MENLHKFIKKYTKFRKNNESGRKIYKNLNEKKEKLNKKETKKE
jgi:hypothetical protein